MTSSQTLRASPLSLVIVPVKACDGSLYNKLVVL